MIKRILILLLLSIPVMATAQSKKVKKAANQQTEQWRYEIEPVTVGVQGTAVVKVWSYSKSATVATEQAKKNAVHGVVFKGIPTKERMAGKKPLVESSAKESENAAFFKSFFADGGDYMRFVSLTNSGAVAAGDVLKTDKKEFKVGVNVTVNYNDLRSYLESQGVIKKLGSGF